MSQYVCIEQRWSNIWSSIHEKLSNTEAELKKNVASKKKKTFNYIYAKKFYLRCNFNFLGANFEDFICMVLIYLFYNYGLKLSRIYNDFVFIKLIQGNFTFRFF